MNKCFLCGSLCKNVFTLGRIFPSAFIDSIKDQSNKERVELTLSQCEKCGFVRLNDVLPADEMYREYWYRSSLNSSMIKSLRDVVKSALDRTVITQHAVMDIGCNDGTMLGMYEPGYFRVGYDPANNLKPLASKNCDVFINNYFNGEICYGKKFDIITAIAMFYDVPKPYEFLENVKKYLAPLGTFIIQMTDLTSMLNVNAFDNLCHEHIAYYTLKLLREMMWDVDMEIYDVSYNDVNGGSIRVYVCHTDTRPIKETVEQAMKDEEKILEEKSFDKFKEIVENIRKIVCKFVRTNKTVGLGASTKGNTLLQYFGLDQRDIEYIMEVSPQKFGKKTIGSNIPIISEADGFAKNPDNILILPWHFVDNIVSRNKDYLEKGGAFLVPMPVPMLIDKNGKHTIS